MLISAGCLNLQTRCGGTRVSLLLLPVAQVLVPHELSMLGNVRDRHGLDDGHRHRFFVLGLDQIDGARGGGDYGRKGEHVDNKVFSSFLSICCGIAA
jgi:hypothetical protein